MWAQPVALLNVINRHTPRAQRRRPAHLLQEGHGSPARWFLCVRGTHGTARIPPAICRLLPTDYTNKLPLSTTLLAHVTSPPLLYPGTIPRLHLMSIPKRHGPLVKA